MNYSYLHGIDALLGVDDPRSAAVAAMQSWLGVPYIWGGGDPKTGLDCSGAIMAAWKAAGIYSGKRLTADGLYRATKSISESEVRPGDLVFYGSPLKVNHVMMVVGDGRVIGATGGYKGLDTVAKARAHGAEVKYKLTGYRKDVVGFGKAPVGEPLGSPTAWWVWAAGAVGVVGMGVLGAWLGGRTHATRGAS